LNPGFYATWRKFGSFLVSRSFKESNIVSEFFFVSTHLGTFEEFRKLETSLGGIPIGKKLLVRF
jgi:hypothetical protein